MVKVLSGGSYEPPKRRYFTDNLLPRMQNESCQQIKKDIESISGIGLTTDSWTSCQIENYITYTAHYITEEWEMKCAVLSTQYSENKHTSENLAADIKQTEERWGMNSLLFKPIYVHNNASNITKAPKLLNPPRIGIGCLAHTINLAASSATSIHRVSYILGKARAFIKTFKKSTPAHIVFKRKQELLLPGNNHKLMLDCVTRWNSSYDMLERLNEQSQVCLIYRQYF